MKTILIFISISLVFININAQLINSDRRTTWSIAGLNIPMPKPSSWKNILDFGADKTGILDSKKALDSAITSLSTVDGIIYFPPGTYLFKSTIDLSSQLILKGASNDSTFLNFNLNGAINNCIQFSGSVSTNPKSVVSGLNKGSLSLTLSSVNGLVVGDFIELRVDGTGFMTSSWAMNDLAQICKVTAISGNIITIEKPLRWNFNLGSNPQVFKVLPTRNAGLECFKISRLDTSSEQSSLINFQYAANCWVKGVEGYKTTFGHVSLSKSIHCEVTESYFHHGWSYGGGGRAYGVVVQASSSECLVQNNIFEHLRHSVLIQSGANGNVIGYNYSSDPFWEQTILPTNSAGEIVLHGNFPFMNLIEGNIVDNIVIDNSHGVNGPFNTLHRNRASNYGIFMNTSVGDSTNFVNNELLKSTVFFVSTYNLTGNGNFEYGNNHNGTVKPLATSINPDLSSYYLSSTPSWFNSGSLPTIGYPNSLNSGSIPAKLRFTNTLNRCACINRINFDSSKISAGPDKSRYNCSGDSVQIGINSESGFTYSWSPILGLSSSNLSNPFAKPSITTSYILTASNSTIGVVIIDTVLVSVINKPLPSLSISASDTIIKKGDTVLLSATGAQSYLWSPNVFLLSSSNTNPIKTKPDSTLTYQVTGYDSLGCFSTKTITIRVENLSSLYEKNIGIKIYPNPASKFLNIETELKSQLKISNLVGQIYYESNFSQYISSIYLAKWPIGIYLVEITNLKGVHIYKLNKSE